MNNSQQGILSEKTAAARYLSFILVDEADLDDTLQALQERVDGEQVVVGIGLPLVQALGVEVPGLRVFPAQSGKGIAIPSTQAALWFWLRGTDRGELYHRSREITELVGANFELADVIDSFPYDMNRDLSGYEDGTENPTGAEAIEAAIAQGQGAGIDGSSFVAVQQWLHDFDSLDAMTEAERDDVIGRHVSDNEEFDEAPESAHAKRAAQESYDPEAFVVRRSMPWAEEMAAGLVFVAFGKSFDAYEAILHRMIGLEDGITDGLFRFTRPLTGGYYWCPPMKDGKLDLSVLKIG
jgi:putative iron-dependent peroxidase